MGCGRSKRITPNEVIQPENTAGLGGGLPTQQFRPNMSVKTSLVQTREYTTKDRLDLSPETSVLKHVTTENRTITSPRSVGFFNVACWCNDKDILRGIEQNPLLDYTPSGSTQKIKFNRISAPMALEAKTQVTAVVYLVAHTDDVPLVKQFYTQFSHIWNHFVVVSHDLSDLDLPLDLPIPVLRPHHNLHKEIHDSYLDQLVVIDAYLSQEEGSTPHTRKMETLDLMRKNTVSMDDGLHEVRKFWVKNRFRMWTIREFFRKTTLFMTENYSKMMGVIRNILNTETPVYEGNVHLTFGETGGDYPTQFSLHLGVNSIMEHIALPTASLIKYSDRDCWLCISLVPNPECLSSIDGHVLAGLAKTTYEKMTRENPVLKELFGYDIQ